MYVYSCFFWSSINRTGGVAGVAVALPWLGCNSANPGFTNDKPFSTRWSVLHTLRLQYERNSGYVLPQPTCQWRLSSPQVLPVA